MGKSAIEWLRGPVRIGGKVTARDFRPLPGHGFSFSAWWGCYQVGPGCDHCYAMAFDARGLVDGMRHWGVDAPIKYFGPEYWAQPLRWNAIAAEHGVRYDVFLNPFADTFDNRADPEIRAGAFALMKATPHLNWIIVTKRIGNAAGMLPPDWSGGYPNVWILITVVNQAEAERDIPKLLRLPAMIRGLSVEPMLGLIHLHEVIPDPLAWTHAHGFNGLGWVICGDESGTQRRPIDLNAVRSLRNQCVAAGVPFFLKQLHVDGRKVSMPELDGQHHLEWPA